ncbi:hypothetical protein AYI68_g7877 [Smittium mucronatum]|uniref:Uncharacterized protein n=1 Tax=Smittium mucronatum TaxID=133383 RepID=A0A1R0GMH2_9FUNG|nr:hypothetical protein AYI68_g7877 [Smittium mucronatum]
MVPPLPVHPIIPHFAHMPGLPMGRIPMNFPMPMGHPMNNMAINQQNMQFHQQMARNQLNSQMRPGMMMPQMPMNLGMHQPPMQFNAMNGNNNSQQNAHINQKRKLEE